MQDDVLCRGKNLDGSKCTRHHSKGSFSCAWHDPERADERARKLEEQAARIRATAVVAMA